MLSHTTQFDGTDRTDSIREAAWAHLRMSDTKYMPLEPCRLREFLSKWGAFPHIQVRITHTTHTLIMTIVSGEIN